MGLILELNIIIDKRKMKLIKLDLLRRVKKEDRTEKREEMTILKSPLRVGGLGIDIEPSGSYLLLLN